MLLTAHDLKVFGGAQQGARLLGLVEPELGLQTEDAAVRIVQAFLGDDAVLDAGLHEAEVFFKVVEEQEGVATGSDRQRDVVLASHG